MSVNRIATLLGGILLVALAACAPPPTPPTVAVLDIQAAPDINPEASGRPSPVVLGIYQLSSPAAFSSSDYFQLAQSPAETLGSDMLAEEQLPIRPGDAQRIEREMRPGAGYIGLVAGFRDIDQAAWRAVVPVPAEQTTVIPVRIGRNSVQAGGG